MSHPRENAQTPPEVLLDFASGFAAVTSPPLEFGDAQVLDMFADSGDSLPSGLNDLPPSIRDMIDCLVENNSHCDDEATMALIDAMILGEYTDSTCTVSVQYTDSTYTVHVQYTNST